MLMRGIALSLLVAMLVALGGCEGEDDGPVRRETAIGHLGGVAQSFDRRAQIQVPPGALDGPQRIAIERAAQYPVDEALVSGTAYLFGPAGLEFAVPATVTISYEVRAIPDGFEETDLHLARMVGVAWQALPGSEVDLASNTVSAPVSDLSTFAIRAGGTAPPPGGTVIGPEGGVATSADGHCAVQIPSGALTASITLTIAPAFDSIPHERLIEGTTYACDPEALVFNETATITISYAQAEIGLGLDESAFTIARATPAGWTSIAESVADPDTRTVSAPIDGFSVFAILGAPLVPSSAQ